MKTTCDPGVVATRTAVSIGAARADYALSEHGVPSIAGRPRVLAIVPSLIPSTIVGILNPLVALARRGEIDLRFRLEKNCSPRDAAWADVAVFCRNREPAYRYWLDSLIRWQIPY